jgi:hypothetical protein
MSLLLPVNFAAVTHNDAKNPRRVESECWPCDPGWRATVGPNRIRSGYPELHLERRSAANPFDDHIRAAAADARDARRGRSRKTLLVW